jgi:hypothetical protein
VTVVPGDSAGHNALTRTFRLPDDLEPGEYELGGELCEGEICAEGAASLDDLVCPLVLGNART